ncbi:UV DNA damage repair endonuclease UvsE [Evansella halocellulosilytica]|uniref:UV DNA damage repair endonuclease UvsE n=1 Tax=Evansella halocellulosilytica TaxID=2011013 RepID=UPI000BB7E2F9|nr:UV DNA damage repair endonuclease UvsE [Evansella halocellulosilytica]
MTLVRLGYVAMSVELKNSSPSQTMTYTHYKKYNDLDAARRKLERIALSNLENCLRLLKHNKAHDITFFRFSSKIVPLATHPELNGWDYINPLQDKLMEIGDFIKQNKMRIDFHPDHFVLLNSPKKEVLVESLKTLKLHIQLLNGMNIDLKHRCVMHVGGRYNNKALALERFIENWQTVPKNIQQTLMLENDDKTFNLNDTLFLCEKLNIPLVFDYHHHLANHMDENWQKEWERVISTWKYSPLPLKMHISSPKTEKQFRHHADFIDIDMFINFLNEINGTVPRIDCMIEAKRKDHALFQLMNEIKEKTDFELVNQSCFQMK